MTSTETKRVADSELDDVFRPLFDRIAEGAVARETDRALAHAEIADLRAARFGALRVPVEFGGDRKSVV